MRDMDARQCARRLAVNPVPGDALRLEPSRGRSAVRHERGAAQASSAGPDWLSNSTGPDGPDDSSMSLPPVATWIR
jgi:hypothetical protein